MAFDPIRYDCASLYPSLTDSLKRAFINSNPHISPVKSEPKDTDPLKEEWIWVDGYKGTDSDMKCRDYQYELGKQYDMPEDAEIKTCYSGFHLCLNLRDVFNYYSIGHGYRYFKVSALVRKSDVDKYDGKYFFGHDKLVSKSIIFVRELSIDEIFKDTEYAEWNTKYKELAMAMSPSIAKDEMHKDELVDLGYSEVFAKYVANEGEFVINTAKVVASQPGLSMDMKVFAIFQTINKK